MSKKIVALKLQTEYNI